MLQNKLNEIEQHFKGVPGTYHRFDQLLQTINVSYRYDVVVRMINVAAQLLNNGLEVRKSENPIAGNGLFTMRPFKEGTILTQWRQI